MRCACLTCLVVACVPVTVPRPDAAPTSAPALVAPAPPPDAASLPDASRSCRSGVLGGWGGSKDCLAGRSRWSDAPPQDLACDSDADCELISTGCFAIAVRPEVAAWYRALRPCVNPAAGQCRQRRLRARCTAGCCEVHEDQP